jgi:hypothetical protein
MSNLFKYFTITSISYLTTRRIFYYPLLESKDNKPILYSEYIVDTLMPFPMFILSFPIALYSDIIFVEKYLRKIPIEQRDILFPFTFGNYTLKKKYLNKL